MNGIRFAAAAALLTIGGAASAQTATNTDAGCIIVSNAFAHSVKDTEAQKIAEASLYFYLGRIGEHATAAQLKPIFDAAAKTITDATAPALMSACVKELQAKTELVEGLQPKPPAQPQSPTKNQSPTKTPQGR